MLKTIGKRVPPGDRWEIEETSEIFSSLTDALNYIYLKFKEHNSLWMLRQEL